GTEAVSFDPVTDDDDEFPDASHNAADAEVAALLRQVGAGDDPAGKDAAGDNTAGGDGDTGAATEAVAFDPFADDDDEFGDADGDNRRTDAVAFDPFADEDDNDDSERSEEHTSELQSRFDLVCRLLLDNRNRAVGADCRGRGWP